MITMNALIIYAIAICILAATAAFVILKENKLKFLLLIICLASFTGIIKVFLGFKELPIIYDAMAIMVFGYAFLQEWLKGREKNITLPYNAFFILIFMILAGIEMFNPALPSIERGIYGFRMSGVFYMLCFFGAMLIIKTKEDVIKLMKVLLGVGILVALYGIYQYVHPSAKEIVYATKGDAWEGWHYMAKPFSTMIGPFHYGTLMLICSLMVITALVVANIINVNRIILGIVLVIMLSAMLLSLTRSSYIGLVIGVIVIVSSTISVYKISSRILIRLAGLTMVGCIIGFLVVAVIPKTQIVLLRLTMLTDMRDNALVSRLNAWHERVQQILQNPLGYGIGINSGENIMRASDNEFLAIGIEMGVIGILLFTIIMGLLVRQCILILRRTDDLELRAIAVWITAVVVSMLSIMMTNHILQAYPINMYFWLLVGILYKINHYEMNMKKINN
jgi:hypothetical protein